MFTRSRRGCVAALALIVSVSAVGAQVVSLPQAQGVREDVLYLQTGDVETAMQPNLLEALPPLGFAAAQRYVLQLDGPMTPARLAALEDAGVVLGDYLPRNAWVADLAGAPVASVAALDFVHWLGEYRAEWKVAPDLGQRDFVTPERQEIADAGRVVVEITLFEGADVDAARAAVAALDGATIHREHYLAGNDTLTATVALADVPELADIAEVQFIEDAPEVTLRNSTTRWIVQSNASGVFPLYDRGLHGENQIAGVMDGKLDHDHCSFDDSEPIGPTHRKILAYNTSLGSDSHGTHVSGTIVGDGGSDTDTRGIAYLAKMVFDDIPGFNQTAVYNALSLHHDQGARSHTNSWGNDGTTQYDSMCRGFDAFQYDNEESFVCLAVTNTSTLKNPENAKNLLAVGASQDTPSQHQHCTGGRGPTSDGRRKPELYAPGCSTNSSRNNTTCSTLALTGTSMASPAVGGTALLVRQYYEDGFYPTGVASGADAFTPSGALMKATLLNSAVDMTGVTGYPSDTEGWGRVLADDALYFDGDARAMVVEDIFNADGLITGEVFETNLEVLSSSETLKVTVVWTEPAATAGTSFAQVNDLDLEVVSPTFDVYRGNNFSGGVSVPGGSKDDRNNVEQVHIENPQVGSYTVRIVGAAVNEGRQGFALVATGEVSQVPPAFTISLPEGAPDEMLPGKAVTFDVMIAPGLEEIVPGSEQLVYRYDGGDFISVALDSLGGDLYEATLPPADCDDTPEFYVTATGSLGTVKTVPDGAPANVFAAVVGETVLDYEDTLEIDLGWTVGAGDDDATTGVWERVDPQGTAAQPEDDHTAVGVNCFVTDGDAGSSVGSFDVDGGKTTLFSPLIDLTEAPGAVMSYWRWYSNDQGSSPNEDIFVVEISNDGGASWSEVETVGPSGAGTSGGWIQHEFVVADILPLTDEMQLRFIASDEGAGSIVEAAVDDLRVTRFVCKSGGCPNAGCENGDLDGDCDVDLDDLSLLLAQFGTTYDLEDLAALLSEFGTDCN